MFGRIYHVGLTVRDIEKSIRFYRDVLGLKYEGQLLMDDEATSILYGRRGCKAKVAYLNGSEEINMPPVELIEFVSFGALDQGTKQKEGEPIQEPSLFVPSIAELCFCVTDIDKEYERLVAAGVECLSSPQFFDFSKDGFGKSKAFYFKDPDGIILEAMEPIED